MVNGAVSVRDGRIASVGAEPARRQHDVTIDATGHFLLPGFVQTHIHLCQTLFRGYADDLRLMDWLRTRIWPMEAAHTPASLRAAARLACLELLRSGTTSILTMETVHDTDAVIEATAATGIRATIGKCLMDETTPDAPARLRENGRAALDESLALVAPATTGRRTVASESRSRRASRSRVRGSCSKPSRRPRRTWRDRPHARVRTAGRGRDGPRGDRARQHRVLRTRRAAVAAPQHRALRVGRRRRAGAAGASPGQGDALPRLEPQARVGHRAGSGDAEPRPLRLARRRRRGLQQPPRHVRRDASGGRPPVDPALARSAVRARRPVDGDAERAPPRSGWTRKSARSRSARRPTSSSSTRMSPQMAPSPDPFSAIVYAAHPGDVRLTMVDGEILVKDGAPLHLDAAEIAAEARSHAAELARRAL